MAHPISDSHGDSDARPGRMGVGVIGAGRVGAVLGSALRAAGHAIVGVSAVSQESLERADVLLPGVPILPIPHIVERAELVIVAVPDDVLGDVVAGIAAADGWQLGQIIAHVSGRHGLAVLEPAATQGAIPLALHPAMTFTGTSLDLARLEGTPFAVTARGPFLPIAQALVVEVGGEPVVVEEADRVAYHAGLAHASNPLVTVLSQAAAILRGAGVAEPGTMLSHLVVASVEGALRYASDGGDPMGALTGPVSRGDADTVTAHLTSLANLGTGSDAELVHTYRELARATAARAHRVGRVNDAQRRDIDAALDRAQRRERD